MNRTALLLRTPAVSLSRFDHPPADAHRDPDFEQSPIDSINIVEAGTFTVRVDGAEHLLEPGTAFVTSKGMGFTCVHPDGVPTDRCLSLSFREEAVEDLRSADVPALRPPFARITTRERFLHRRLSGCAPGDEMRLELLAGALFESLATEGRPRVAPTRIVDADLERRIERSIQRTECDFARVLTLDDLARTAGMSAFHFARVFREFTGLPPHRYLMAIRLHQAARLLDQGASVSSACLDSGFGSLSHFITAFRKRFGVVPSEIKRGRRIPALRAVLKAPVWTRPRQ